MALNTYFREVNLKPYKDNFQYQHYTDKRMA